MSWHAQQAPRSTTQWLPWWALALPVLAFVALLALVASPGAAATPAAAEPLLKLAGHVTQVVPDLLSRLP